MKRDYVPVSFLQDERLGDRCWAAFAPGRRVIYADHRLIFDLLYAKCTKRIATALLGPGVQKQRLLREMCPK